MKKSLLFLLCIPFTTFAQTDSATVKTEKKAHWYEHISMRGYMQVRYNRLLETNPKYKNEQGDKSIGDNGGIFIRRMRLIFFGQLSERIYFYVQPDLASAVNSTTQNFMQMRDAYVDVGFDKKNEFRIRLGQSKVPFGFENMQSSQNRMPLDRSDAVNSAIPNERDLGAFFYWAPDKIRKRFASLVSDGLKGPGDYGVLALGVFNGQTTNKPELNNQLHGVARLTYPFKIGKKQIIEPSIQGYTGHIVIPSDQINTGVKLRGDKTYLDKRVGGSLVVYPQPFGFQAEYNVGTGPCFDPLKDSITIKPISGGYAMVSYFFKYKHQSFYPFVRLHQYTGGKKQEIDARSYSTNTIETEGGIEWLPIKNFELTVQYTIADRKFEDFKTKGNSQAGQFLRIQAQLNF